jgi:hypothetical protein
MNHKHTFFISGIVLGIAIPLVEYGITNNRLDVLSKFEEAILIGGEVWHYIFLYLVSFNALLVYVKNFREKINPDSRVVFLTSGVAFGFSILSIVSASIRPFQ